MWNRRKDDDHPQKVGQRAAIAGNSGTDVQRGTIAEYGISARSHV